jgi:hypothetical protein
LARHKDNSSLAHPLRYCELGSLHATWKSTPSHLWQTLGSNQMVSGQ